jgi:hypothetical protein
MRFRPLRTTARGGVVVIPRLACLSALCLRDLAPAVALGELVVEALGAGEKVGARRRR